MSNVLFVNLKRNGDIFNTAALAQSYLKEHPHAIAYILTYDEFKKSTRPLSMFKGVFTLDRKKLTTFTSHGLYSNGFALDELFDELKMIESVPWTEIVNYSSDKASTFLCSYLASGNNAEVKGITFGASNNINYKSNWDVLFNEIMTTKNYSPIHFSRAYHGILGIKEFIGPYSIKTVKKHDETVNSNFNSLRKLNSSAERSCSLIGIQLSSSLESKEWDDKKLTSLIANILDDSSLYPLILIAPTESEREIARNLNSNFDEKLVVIESDFLALSSVLNGLDVLVTPDTSVKHLANLNDCKVLEYTNDLYTSFKQGSVGVGNVIVKLDENSEQLIFDCIKFLLDPTDNTLSAVCDDNVYFTYRDRMGWNLRPVNGSFSRELLLRQLKRTYIAEWCEISYDWDIKKYFSDYNYSSVQNIIDEEKTYVSEISRDLLGTLRSLVKASETSHEASNFITSLDRLLNHCESDHVGSIPVIEFKALLENLESSSNSERLRAAEDLLYKLKKNLQLTLNCLNKVEKDARSMPIKKSRLDNRVTEVTV